MSARTLAGVDQLKSRLLQAVGFNAGSEGVYLARARHLDAIRRAGEHLAQAAVVWQQVEIFAEELRAAQNALSEITGEFTPDDLLGVIFSRFCIGK
jgi:tRNA modification GTPase